MRILRFIVVVQLLLSACHNQVRTKSFGPDPLDRTVVMGGPYEDTLVLAPNVYAQRAIKFTSHKDWTGPVWVTQVGSAANLQWKQLSRYPTLDTKDRLGWIYQYQTSPRYVGTTTLEFEPDGYKLGMSHVTVRVIGPITNF